MSRFIESYQANNLHAHLDQIDKEDRLQEGFGALAGTALGTLARVGGGAMISAAGGMLAAKVLESLLANFTSPNSSEDKLNKFIDAKLRDLPESERAKLREMIKKKWREQAKEKKESVDPAEEPKKKVHSSSLTKTVLNEGLDDSWWGAAGRGASNVKDTYAKTGRTLVKGIPQSRGPSLKDIYKGAVSAGKQIPGVAKYVGSSIINAPAKTTLAAAAIITIPMIAAAVNYYMTRPTKTSSMSDSQLRADITNNLEKYVKQVSVVTRAELDPPFKKRLVEEIFQGIRTEEKKAARAQGPLSGIKVSLSGAKEVGAKIKAGFSKAAMKLGENVLKYAMAKLATWAIQQLCKPFGGVSEAVLKRIMGGVVVIDEVGGITSGIKKAVGDAVTEKSLESAVDQALEKLKGNGPELLSRIRKEIVEPFYADKPEVAGDDEFLSMQTMEFFNEVVQGKRDNELKAMIRAQMKKMMGS